MLWTAEVILHLGYCASAGAVSQWYFASVDGTSHPGYSPFGTAIGLATWRTLRYAPGSLVLGALLVIPGRIFRFFLEHCLHQAQTDGRGKPELRGVANCCMFCCLDCSTKCALLPPQATNAPLTPLVTAPRGRASHSAQTR